MAARARQAASPSRADGTAIGNHHRPLEPPLLGMLLAAEAYLRLIRPAGAICAKLHHPYGQPCIFRCGYPTAAARPAPAVTAARPAETTPTKAVTPSLEQGGSEA
ncbi:MAG TPA: hypothetical protein VFE37_09985 [Chloroflexota bacterium]|nr:hypothetical protein [Chloroflexota bacterium]